MQATISSRGGTTLENYSLRQLFYQKKEKGKFTSLYNQ
jgi:hypothetical protein